MKMPISWHQRCFENWSLSIEKEQERINNLSNSLSIQRGRLEFYGRQIELARQQKKDGFDSDRFMGGRK
jgi:hypothetical protein